MDDNYIVEVWGQPAGIVLKEEGVYRFHATASPFFALEGTEYDKPGKARLAAARLTGKQRQRAADATARPASAAERAPRSRRQAIGQRRIVQGTGISPEARVGSLEPGQAIALALANKRADHLALMAHRHDEIVGHRARLTVEARAATKAAVELSFVRGSKISMRHCESKGFSLRNRHAMLWQVV